MFALEAVQVPSGTSHAPELDVPHRSARKLVSPVPLACLVCRAASPRDEWWCLVCGGLTVPASGGAVRSWPLILTEQEIASRARTAALYETPDRKRVAS